MFFCVNNDVTMAVRSRFLNFFLLKKIIFILKIGFAKFEVILANTSPNFISVLVQMRFFLTFQRCSSDGDDDGFSGAK